MSMYTICKGWLTNFVNIPSIYEVFIISDYGLSVKNKPQITLTLDFIMLLKIRQVALWTKSRSDMTEYDPYTIRIRIVSCRRIVYGSYTIQIWSVHDGHTYDRIWSGIIVHFHWTLTSDHIWSYTIVYDQIWIVYAVCNPYVIRTLGYRIVYGSYPSDRKSG